MPRTLNANSLSAFLDMPSSQIHSYITTLHSTHGHSRTDTPTPTHKQNVCRTHFLLCKYCIVNGNDSNFYSSLALLQNGLADFDGQGKISQFIIKWSFEQSDTDTLEFRLKLAHIHGKCSLDLETCTGVKVKLAFVASFV